MAYVPMLAVMTVGPTPAAERYTETLRKQSAAVGLAAWSVSRSIQRGDAAAVRAQILELNHRREDRRCPRADALAAALAADDCR